jgi:hypothetical protein
MSASPQTEQERRVAELADWWWQLSFEERVRIRSQFRERLEIDPVFRAAVRRLLSPFPMPVPRLPRS